jgi:hypothetical protein
MNNLKIFGLAAIAVMALPILFGASTASATTLFTDPTKTTHYAAGTELQMSLTKGASSVFTGSGGESLNTCTGSTIAGKTSTTSGAPLWIVLSGITWSNCTNTTHTIANGFISIEWTSGTTGTVGSKNIEVTVDGIFGVSCTWGTGTGTKLGTITGGSELKLKIAAEGLIKTAGSALMCPQYTNWDAEYTLTKPHALYPGA